MIIKPTIESCTAEHLHLLTNACLCIQVREACSILDLDVLFYPCPKDGPNWRPKVGLWAWPSGSADEDHVSLVYALYSLDTTNTGDALSYTILPCHLFGLHNINCWLLMSVRLPYCSKLASQQLASLAVSTAQDGLS